MDLYETLGVKKNATPATIKAAFRRIAKTTHPDHGGDRQQFERIRMAYGVLMDNGRRAHYDATGEVQEQKPDNRQSAAIAVLSQAFVAVLNELSESRKQPNQSDLVALMRRRLASDIDQRGKERVKNEAARKPLADLRDRFTAKDDKPNWMARIIDGQIAEIDRRVAQCDQADETARMALEILDDQEFNVDRPEASIQIVMTGATFSSTTTSGF